MGVYEMLRGGYKIIDLKGQNIPTSGTITVDGIYDRITRYGKPILVSGLVNNGVSVSDSWVNFALTGSTLYGEITKGVILSITNANVVSIVAEIPAT